MQHNEGSSGHYSETLFEALECLSFVYTEETSPWLQARNSGCNLGVEMVWFGFKFDFGNFKTFLKIIRFGWFGFKFGFVL